ncbi:MAG: amidohydrolase [Longimicrobiales bacterium]
MSEITRSEFLGLGAALAAGLSAGCGPDGSSSREPLDRDLTPDLVLLNGRILTQDEGFPVAEALAVRRSRFLAVGSTRDVSNLIAQGRTQVVDAAGMTVLPGFIDSHSHPSSVGLSELKDVNVNLGSIARIQRAVRERANRTPPGEWIVGFMYDDTKLQEGRPLNRRDLDEAAPNHPVAVGHRGGHTGVYNSLAFELAGVTADTPDPPGGAFYRENGELTGKVAERARGVFSSLIPRESTRQERQEGVAVISRKMAAAGLTSVCQTGTSASDFTAYQDALQAGELHFRMYAMARGGSYRDLRAAGVRTGLGDEWLKVGSAKFSADGSASERTMRMSTPYEGRPDDYGILTMSQEEIHEAVEEAHRSGWQVAIHANGDVTIDMVLNAYERVQELWPRPDPRHRIEHCSLVNPDLLKRIKTVGAIPAPFYTYAHYHGEKWVEYGEARMEWMFAHRSFLEYDIPAAPASDHPPGPFEPLMALQSMVTRKDYAGRVWGPSQRITLDQALRVCTRNGAYASFEEEEKGSITAGKLADFVILAEDPYQVDPDALKEIRVARTVVGGRTVYEG